MKKIIGTFLCLLVITALLQPVFATTANNEKTYAICEITDGEYDVLSTAQNEIFAEDVCTSLKDTYKTRKFVVKAVSGCYHDVTLIDAEHQLNG